MFINIIKGTRYMKEKDIRYTIMGVRNNIIERFEYREGKLIFSKYKAEEKEFEILTDKPMTVPQMEEVIVNWQKKGFECCYYRNYKVSKLQGKAIVRQIETCRRKG